MSVAAHDRLQWPAGICVRLCGLLSSRELNGEEVIILPPLPANLQKMRVRVRMATSSRELSIRAENLQMESEQDIDDLTQLVRLLVNDSGADPCKRLVDARHLAALLPRLQHLDASSPAVRDALAAISPVHHKIIESLQPYVLQSHLKSTLCLARRTKVPSDADLQHIVGQSKAVFPSPWAVNDEVLQRVLEMMARSGDGSACTARVCFAAGVNVGHEISCFRQTGMSITIGGFIGSGPAQQAGVRSGWSLQNDNREEVFKRMEAVLGVWPASQDEMMRGLLKVDDITLVFREPAIPQSVCLIWSQAALAMTQVCRAWNFAVRKHPAVLLPLIPNKLSWKTLACAPAEVLTLLQNPSIPDVNEQIMDDGPRSDSHALALVCRSFSKLSSLFISGYIEGWAFDTMRFATNLRDLALNYVEGETSRFAGAAVGWSRLRVARLGRYWCDDMCLKALGEHCHDLQELTCDRCSLVSSKGVVALARGCSKLIVLALCRSSVGKKGIEAIAAHSRELQDLDVSECSSLSTGLSALLNLFEDGPACPRLQRLNIGSIPNSHRFSRTLASKFQEQHRQGLRAAVEIMAW